MKSKIHKSIMPVGAMVIVALFVLVAAFTFSVSKVTYAKGSKSVAEKGRMLTIFDRGHEKIILTQQPTVGEALREAGIKTDINDVVEPNINEKLVASNYKVNIYRARPVVIVDGNNRTKITTAYQTAQQIIESAGIKLYDEDKTTLSQTTDILSDGVGLQVTIDRAVPVNLVLYGKIVDVRTQATTIAQMLSEKGIQLNHDDQVSPSLDTEIIADMAIRVWREGKQIVSVDEVVPFEVEQIEDIDRPIGYSEIRVPGVNGLRSVSYEITIRDGVEVGRSAIASIDITLPKKQTETIGRKGQYTTPSENENITWDYLINQGFTRNQTAGIMGNLRQENKFNTDGDGIAQWIGGRRDNLYAKPYPNNIYTQLDFLMEELNGSRSWILRKLKKAEKVIDAVIIFQDDFEVCGICMQEQRVQFAYDILESH